MPGPLGLMGTFGYLSDSGTLFGVSMNASKAEAGGFAEFDGLANYPRKWVMRHVYGEQSDGTRISLPIADAGHTLFINGGSFVVHGETYEVRGRIGEKRPSGATA